MNQSGIQEEPHGDEAAADGTAGDHVRGAGANDGVERTPLSAEALARYFPAGARVEALPGVGHWPQREAPAAVVRAVTG